MHKWVLTTMLYMPGVKNDATRINAMKVINGDISDDLKIQPRQWASDSGSYSKI